MLQRNTTVYPWTFTGPNTRQVRPGETTDHPVLLDGWTPAEGETPEPEPAKTSPAKTSKPAKPGTAADTEGGEPQ